MVTDPDESPVSTYEWTVGGNVIGSSATLDLSTTGVMPDDVVTCTVSAVDSDGATATDAITQMVSNRAPTLANTSVTPNSGITTDTALTCATSVSDDDGESLTPTYTWNVGSNTYTGDSLQLDSTMSAPGRLHHMYSRCNRWLWWNGNRHSFGYRDQYRSSHLRRNDWVQWRFDLYDSAGL